MNSLLAYLSFIFVATSLVMAPCFAQHSTEGGSGSVGGGGEAVVVGNEISLRDLRDRSTCRWQTGDQFARAIPGYSQWLAQIAQSNLLFAIRLSWESEQVRFCMTAVPLRRVRTDDVPTTVYYVEDRRRLPTLQAAVRIDNEIYVDSTVYERLSTRSRRFLCVHEFLHSFIPMDTPRRNTKLRSMVASLAHFSEGRMTAEELRLQAQMNQVSEPLDIDQSLNAFRSDLLKVHGYAAFSPDEDLRVVVRRLALHLPLLWSKAPLWLSNLVVNELRSMFRGSAAVAELEFLLHTPQTATISVESALRTWILFIARLPEDQEGNGLFENAMGTLSEAGQLGAALVRDSASLAIKETLREIYSRLFLGILYRNRYEFLPLIRESFASLRIPVCTQAEESGLYSGRYLEEIRLEAVVRRNANAVREAWSWIHLQGDRCFDFARQVFIPYFTSPNANEPFPSAWATQILNELRSSILSINNWYSGAILNAVTEMVRGNRERWDFLAPLMNTDLGAQVNQGAVLRRVFENASLPNAMSALHEILTHPGFLAIGASQDNIGIWNVLASEPTPEPFYTFALREILRTPGNFPGAFLRIERPQSEVSIVCNQMYADESCGRPTLLNQLSRWGMVEEAVALIRRTRDPRVLNLSDSVWVPSNRRSSGVGYTLLMEAAWRGQTAIVDALLERRGVDVCHQRTISVDSEGRSHGETALDLARGRGYRDIAARLERAMSSAHCLR